jgi:uncharacterized protein (DUF1501 family)
MPPMSRRQMLRYGGGLSMLGAATPFALQMAAVGSAAGQTAPDYKALVCVFLFGGNDANNMVLATDSDSFGRYFSARNTGASPIALMPVGTAATPVGQTSPVTGRVATATSPEAWGGVIPIAPTRPNPVPAGTNASARTFALHPFMGPAKNLFDQGRLAVLANVGTLIMPITKAQYVAKSVPTPVNLYSHNDQQSEWQAGRAEGARTGWGGQFADALAGANGSNSLFTAISVAGNAVFLSGQSVVQYQLSTSATPAVLIAGTQGSSLFGSTGAPGVVSTLMQDVSPTNYMIDDYATVVSRSINSATAINSAFATAGPAAIAAPTSLVNPLTGVSAVNPLAVQLQTVAKMIASSTSLGLKRQVFFVSLGGWDTHQNQNTTQPVLLAEVAHALAYFDGVLSSVGGIDRRAQVTTFTASDFSRTFTTNGSGTDHAWGSHHLIMGGAVNGKNIYGQFPTVGVDLGSFKNPDMATNALVPTTSVDQYAATLGAWFGASPTTLNTIFPNLHNFSSQNLGLV